MDELVFAIPTNELWEFICYKEKGFIPGKRIALYKMIQQGLFRKRNELEEDPSFKQIIPYAIISNKESFFLFKRKSGQTEKRLRNKFSIGIGGHMNPGNSKESKEKYLMNELRRELFEEVLLFNSCFIEDIEFIGFINDDTISVGSVHIGLLYNIRVSNKDVVVNEPDKMSAEWIEKPDLANYYNGMESWSKIAFDDYII